MYNIFQYLVLLAFWNIIFFWLFRQHHFIFIIPFLWLGLTYLQKYGKSRYFYLTHTIAALTPIFLMWMLYHTALQAWWLADDPFLLKNLVEQGIFSHFYQSDVWRSLSPANLTPWVVLSLGIDWHWFGLEPLGYYWHHLLSFSLILLIAYQVLNLFFSPLICSIALSLLVASVPSANIAQFLMVRHYLEGLGLSLLALWSYVRAVQTQQQSWAFGGSFFYLLATTAKEIYVPLVVVLPCLPIGSWKQRWKKLIPFIVVAGSYVFWRAYMLKPNHLVTGYGEAFAPQLDWDGVLALPNRLAEVLGWQHTWQWLIVGLAIALFLWILVKYIKKHNPSYILVWLAATLLPIVPVLSILDSRYLFLPYFIFCVGIAVSLQILINKQWHFLVLGISFSLLTVGIKSVESSSVIFRYHNLLERYRLEGEFVLTDHSSNNWLLNPYGAEGHYSSLQWFRTHILKLPPGPKICYDLCICQPQLHDHIYQYEPGTLKILSVSEPAQSCGNKPSADLTVHLWLEDHTLFWQLGPYQLGQYYATVSTQPKMTGQWLLVPTSGNYSFSFHQKIYVIVRYVSPAGWQTYSPQLVFDPSPTNAQRTVQLKWKRHSSKEKTDN